MRIRYISWLPGTLGTQSESLDLPQTTSLNHLMDTLALRNSTYQRVFSHKNVIFASRNGTVIDHATPLTNTDEIVLFSPIAGG